MARASNVLPLAERQRAALRSGPVGSKPYLASMQASLRLGKGQTQTTNRKEVQRVAVAVSRYRETAKPIARRQQERQRERSRAEAVKSSRKNLERSERATQSQGGTPIFTTVDRQISPENITIKIVAERMPDTPANRAEAIERAQGFSTAPSVDLDIPGFTGREAEVNYVSVTAYPAGDYPRDTFATPKTRGKDPVYEHFDDFIEIEVWVEIEGT
jgi:hypothetical protein